MGIGLLLFIVFILLLLAYNICARQVDALVEPIYLRQLERKSKEVTLPHRPKDFPPAPSEDTQDAPDELKR
jgi:hypothetical protein